MVYIALTLLVILIIIFIIFYSQLFISCYIQFDEQQIVLSIKINFYRVRLFKRNLQFNHDHTMKEVIQFIQQHQFTNFLQGLYNENKQIYPFIFSFLNKIHIRDIKWHSKVGAGGHDITGLVAGSLWSVKGIVISLISSNCRVNKVPNMKVSPQFQQLIFESEVDCTMTIKLKYFISILLKNRKKGG